MTTKTPVAFAQNIIALVWDFDKTLISEYMQTPIFKKFDVSAADFWEEVNGLAKHYQNLGVSVNPDTIYLNHFLTWVQKGKLPQITNKSLREFGQELSFYPGLPEFFPKISELISKDELFSQFNIKVEHYIVSTGFAETIRGSAIAPYVENVWGAEFIESPAEPGYLKNPPTNSESSAISQIATALDNTSKTRYLFEINKGTNKHPQIGVHSKIDYSQRRIPFDQMIYIADGPSDVPAFSILNQSQGHTYAIYPAGDRQALRQVNQLQKDGRINLYGEADYREGSHTWLWLTETTRAIAENMVKRKKDAISSNVSAAPQHFN